MNLKHVGGETYNFDGVDVDMTNCGRTHLQMYRHIAQQLAKRQRPPMSILVNEIAIWSKVYEINFQFWPKQNSVYISKGGVPLADYGGDVSMMECLFWACKYCRRVNPKLMKTVPLPFASIDDLREFEG